LKQNKSPSGRHDAAWLSTAISALALAVAAALSIASLQPRSERPAETEVREFSASRAMAHVGAIAREPRPAGSQAHRRAREHILSVLRGLGIKTEVQHGAANSTRYGLPFDSATVHNVVARLRGTAPTRPIVLVCHYDTVPTSPGAADDGAGVATLLETARAVVAGPRLRQDIVFLFTDAEEIGAAGAERYVTTNGPAAADAVVLNFDARGTAGPVALIETGAGNGALVRALSRLDVTPAASSLLPALARFHGLGTDFRPFREAGAQGMNFALVEKVVYYHTPLDDPSALDVRSLQQQGDLALGLARGLGGLERIDSEPDAHFFPVPGWGLISYPASVAPLISLAATLAFAWLALRTLRRETLRPREAAVALLATIAACLAAAVVTHGVWLGVRALDQTAPFLSTSDTYHVGPYRLGLGLVALATALGAFCAARRFAGAEALALSSGLLWVALLWVSVVMVPGAAYAFALPLVVVSVAAVALNSRRLVGRAAGVRLVVSNIAAVPLVMLWAPITYFLFGGLQLRAAGAVALAVALPTVLVAPLLEAGTAAIRWRAPALVGALAAGLLVYGLAQASFDSRHPRPVSLAYALDTESGRGYWISDRARRDEATEALFQREVSTANLPSFFAEGDVVARAAESEAAELSGPELRLVSDVRSGRRRTLVFRVRSRRAAPWLFAFLERDTKVLETAVNGNPVLGRAVSEPPPEGTRWGFRHVGSGDEEIEWSLTIESSGEPVRIVVVDQSSGIPQEGAGAVALPGDVMFARSWVSGTTLVRAAFQF
jgi:hypothetical protein